MKTHRHLSSKEICDQLTAFEATRGFEDCPQCEAEAASLRALFADLRSADESLPEIAEWDDLLLRRRIREALAKESPHSRSIFDRFAFLRPALASALVAAFALAVWSPLSRYVDGARTPLASLDSRSSELLPAWNPLPDESEDEGLALLAEWTPNEDELAIAGCHAACLSGLSRHEEENLLLSVAAFGSRTPLTGGSPL